MAVLDATVLGNAGTKPAFVIPAASDTVPVGNGGDTFLVVRNTTAASHTITITPARLTSYGEVLPPKVITTGTLATDEAWIPLRQEYVNADAAGRATVTVSDPGTAQVAVVRVG